MIIGVPKEIKIEESRVGLTPRSVRALVERGHKVLVETTAGTGIGCQDDRYTKAGATILPTAEEVFARAALIVKVKEPLPRECLLLRPEQTIFTYLHLASAREQVNLLQQSGCIAIGYETVTNDQGFLPLLFPMSAVAGQMSTQVGAYHLQKPQGGSGTLLGRIGNVSPGKVTIIGGGVVGTNATKMAVGLGAAVTIFEKSPQRVEALKTEFGDTVTVEKMEDTALVERVIASDLVIGSVLVTGAVAPILINRDVVSQMRDGSVVVDVAIDQGGCFETSRPTNHQKPTYLEEGVIHYCVTNMPGAVPRTSTFALNEVTLPFVVELADKGVNAALQSNKHLRNGLNIYRGNVTHEAVAKAFNKPYLSSSKALEELP